MCLLAIRFVEQRCDYPRMLQQEFGLRHRLGGQPKEFRPIMPGAELVLQRLQ